MLSKRIRALFIFLLVPFISVQVNAQQKSQNLVYLSTGGFTTSAHFEHMIKSNSANSFYANVGYGEIYDSNTEFYSTASVQWLLGRKNFQLETGLGVGLGFENAEVFPDFEVGLRYQKSKPGLILRAGLGFPELIYFSAGYGL